MIRMTAAQWASIAEWMAETEMEPGDEVHLTQADSWVEIAVVSQGIVVADAEVREDGS